MALGLSSLMFAVVALGLAPRRQLIVDRGVVAMPATVVKPVALGGGAVTVAAVGVAVWLRSPTIVLVGPWLAWFGWRQRRASQRRASQRQLQSQLIDVVDATILQLRSGQPLPVAFQRSLDDPALARIGESVRPFVDLVRSGARFDEAIDLVARLSSDRGLRLLAATVSTLSVHGGPAVASLERLNDTLRARRSAHQEGRAQAAQAMASAAVMASLPVVFGGVVAIIEPALASFYLRHPLGTICVAVSAALTSLGWLWMERVIGAER